MKQKTSLMLLELVIMLLVFAVAAALCLQAFAWAQRATTQSSQKDLAYSRAQAAAEQLKNSAGDFEALGGKYEDGCCLMALENALTLKAQPLQLEQVGLAGARVCVYAPDGSCLAQIDVCWQEEIP